ncbi:MAG: DUF1566 domain-containing protein [Bacteroidales bacterium]|nr:DUF1566 domain-containing protein [Bacteroidales bacterium]
MKTFKLLALLLLMSTFAKAQQNIQIGDIYTFSDNTQGVVFYIDDQGHGLAVSLQQEKRKWTEESNYVYCQDIVNIPDETEANTELNPGLGKIYTSYILQQLGDVKPIAAKYSREEGEEWYLPSTGELIKLIEAAKADGKINQTLKENNSKLIYGWYWTSSEYDNGQAWRIDFHGDIKKCSKLALRNYARAIRQF